MSPPAPAVPGDMTTTASPELLPSLVISGEVYDDLRKARVGDSDGRTFPVTDADLVKGNVLTSVEDGGHSHAFSDCVIVDVYETAKDGSRIGYLERQRGVKAEYKVVRLARPYVYVSSADTACPTVLQGFEDYNVFSFDLTKRDSRYRVRVQSTGKVDRRVT